MDEMKKSAKKKLAVVSDLMIVIGCGLLLVFTWLVWPVGTWMVGGVMLILLGYVLGLEES